MQTSHVPDVDFERRGEILVVAKPSGQRLLVFLAQHRHAADGLDVGVEAADRPGQHEVPVACRKVCGHEHVPPINSMLAL